MTTPHPSKINGAGDRAVILDKVFELYRKSHFFSLKKQQPTLYKNILEAISKVPERFLIEALTIYKKSDNGDGKISHPNYFKAIALRINNEALAKEPGYSYIKPENVKRPVILGRSI